MDQQQNYIISLIAVFLALGIGILIGASMGENTFVANQIAVIEELNDEIRRHKEEVEAQFLSTARFKEELMTWESLEKEYLNHLLIEDKLKNSTVNIIVQDNLPAGLVDLLKLSGCSYQAYVFAKTNAWSALLTGKEGALKLGTSPALLVDELLELVLMEKEYYPEDGILYKSAEKNLLWVQKEQTAGVSPVPLLNDDQKIFIAYGRLDSLCLELLHRIDQKGKTVLRVDAPEKKENTAVAGLEPVIWEKFTLENFYSKYKLLEFLQSSL